MAHPDPLAVLHATDIFFRRENAKNIHALFLSDKATQRVFTRVPSQKEIFEVMQASKRTVTLAALTQRTRVRCAGQITKRRFGPVGYMELTVMTRATLTPFEREYVWSGKPPDRQTGVFLRHLIVHPEERRRGHASMLMMRAKQLAEQLHTHLYADIRADNAAMRACAQKSGGQPSIFWYSRERVLMVRYRFQ